MRRCGRTVLLSLVLAATGCVTGPDARDPEPEAPGDSQERAIGEAQYLPARQMQGGDYTVSPLVQAHVSEVGERLAAVSDRTLDYEFAVLNSSARHAWALPGGKIAVSRGLLMALESEAELAAVLSHQMGHAAARHGLLAIQRGTLPQRLPPASSDDHSSYAIAGARLAAGLVHLRHGPAAEREADQHGLLNMARAGYDPQTAVALHERLQSGPSDPAELMGGHLPMAERLELMRQTASALGRGERSGVKAYAEAIAALRRGGDAYRDLDAGHRALAEGRPDAALALAEAAVAIEPQEARFHGLKGDIAFARHDHEQAIADYTRAIEIDDRYFKYWLGRGEARRRLGLAAEAAEDLARSMTLLPTADAAMALGRIAEVRGDAGEAIGWYDAAATSTTPAGRDAMARLLILDLPLRPDRYVTAEIKVDRTGRVYLELGNRTPLAVEDLRILLAWREASGGIRRLPLQYEPAIAPGESGIVILGPDYVESLNTLVAQVTSARPVEN